VGYLSIGLRPPTQQDLDELAVQSFTEETGGKVMTIADQLRKEGRQEGIQKATERFVLKMIQAGEDIATISEYTGLTSAEIEQLRGKLEKISA
jgi:predicted transposase/invertase (TIGR01784 family)